MNYKMFSTIETLRILFLIIIEFCGWVLRIKNILTLLYIEII